MDIFLELPIQLYLEYTIMTISENQFWFLLSYTMLASAYVGCMVGYSYGRLK